MQRLFVYPGSIIVENVYLLPTLWTAQKFEKLVIRDIKFMMLKLKNLSSAKSDPREKPLLAR